LSIKDLEKDPFIIYLKEHVMAEGNKFQWKFSLYWQDAGTGEQHFLGSALFGKDHDAEQIKKTLMDTFWDNRLDTTNCIPVVKEADA